ncbi:MAG: hypothetical protein OEZ57_09295 [Nitrospirota bacterium]|nr:hypothetical protein [Nitrospirota bacterium]MDH5585936.1 hypothetical protein [Nitrospirota bacterium]MDH5775092.1 hypothetical protein [Nitrospirota bacterium]
MKLTMKWGGKSQKPKASGTPHKVPWDLLGIRDPRKGPEPKSIEEIRKQAQIISSGGFRQSLPSAPHVEKSKRVKPPKTEKPVKKAKRVKKDS